MGDLRVDDNRRNVHREGSREAAFDRARSNAKTGGVDASRTAAASLVDAATDKDGKTDTRALAALVGDARQSGTAPAVYQSVRAELQRRNPAEATRFDGEVTQTFARFGKDGAAGMGAGLAQGGKGLLSQNPILRIRWEATRSAWNGSGGFTRSLQELLESHGIQHGGNNVHPFDPATSVTKNQAAQRGMSQGQAANVNGAAAEEGVAARQRAQGLNSRVVPRAQRLPGSRVPDVVARIPAADGNPANTVELRTESKVGRTGVGTNHVRPEVAADARALARNAKIRGAGRVMGVVGKRVLLPVAVVMSGVELAGAFHADGNRIGENTGRTASGVAGSWGGAIGGAKAGAAIGTMIGGPGIGTVAGAIVGGVVGALAGDWLGRTGFNTVKSLFHW